MLNFLADPEVYCRKLYMEESSTHPGTLIQAVRSLMKNGMDINSPVILQTNDNNFFVTHPNIMHLLLTRFHVCETEMGENIHRQIPYYTPARAGKMIDLLVGFGASMDTVWNDSTLTNAALLLMPSCATIRREKLMNVAGHMGHEQPESYIPKL